MFRYGNVKNGEFTGEIQYSEKKWPTHTQQKMGVLPMVTVDPVSGRPEHFVKLVSSYQVVGDEVREIFAYEIHPNLTEIRKAELAAIRWKYEIGGIIFDGIQVDTSRESQSIIGRIVNYC